MESKPVYLAGSELCNCWKGCGGAVPRYFRNPVGI